MTSRAAVHNLITDVGGIHVGHAHDERVISGVTAVLIDQPNTVAVHIGGGAPGTRATSALGAEHVVTGLDAIMLSGGSIFGLDASGGAMAVLAERGIGFAIGPARVPSVAQAITFDLLNGGAKDWGRRPFYFDLGIAATEAAQIGPFDLGTVGGGYGATTATFKGGIGSASARTGAGVVVGAIAVVNAVGSATVGGGAHFWAAPYELDREFGGRGPAPRFDGDALALRMKGGAPPSTTIAIVATSARLDRGKVLRLAIMADDGLARAIRPAHAPMDGDTIFAVSTGQDPEPASHAELTALGQLAADCLARAIARGVYEARVPGPAYIGPPAYRDRFPAAHPEG